MNETLSASPSQLPAVIPAPEPVTTATRLHHKYSASKMNYLEDCAAFTSSSTTNEAAEQGTLLHDLMDQMIKKVAKGLYKTTLEQVATWLVKACELTEEEIGYLRFCCKRVDVFLARRPTAILTEISVSVQHPDGTELNHGFLDVLFIFKDVGILMDFKFGWAPVRPAKDNLQGFNYALGAFMKFQELNRIGIEFIQPKLNWVTSHVVERLYMFELYRRLASVVENAEYVQKNPLDAQRYMKPGHYCQYCTLAGTCAVLSNYRAIAATRYADLPMPVSFKGMELTKPADLALARYWCDLVETGIEELKASAFMVAEANGGELRCTLPNGQEIIYEIAERNVDRVLGSAPEIAEALKDFCSPQEILGAAKLAIGKLEPIAKAAMVGLAAARGEKLTKKVAWEQVTATLEAQGLLTRPDSKIRYLKLKKETNKQIEKV
jgi:hypothetical protein